MNAQAHACLGLRRVVGRCTYDVIASQIDDVLLEYGLHQKVSHCVTDR